MPPTPPTKREGPGSGGRATRSEPFEPKPGLVVAGKYRVESIIGEGGMGVVAAATHTELDQRVAIKFLAPEAMRNDEARERFLREAKVAARVKSEHVARVSDVGRVEPDGVPFIVMEYLEGRDLGAMLKDGAQLPIDEACEIALQACEGLAEVHAAGIVHRDLKPSNLFITHRADDSPCVKLLDFGISKLGPAPGTSQSDPSLTATSTIMGSPSYMSPEQLRSTKEVDARTDVWSLGACLYEAIAGKPAFRGETVPQVCFLIGSQDPTPPSTLRDDVPPALEHIVLACLDKDADKRASLVELARGLVAFAPDRARVSLERVEALLGEGPPKKREASLPIVRSVERSRASVVEAPAPSVVEGARTQASWHDDEARRQQPKRRRSGLGALFFLLLGAGSVLAVGVSTGRIDVKTLRGQVSSATSAVGSAVSGATKDVESAVPSALPLPSSVPTTVPTTVGSSSIPSPSAIVSAIASALSFEPEPAPSSSVAGTDDDDDDDTPDAAAPTGGPGRLVFLPTHPPGAPHPPPKHPPQHPRHWPKHKKH